MSRRPGNVAWVGFTSEQSKLLDFIDQVGNNGWARNSYSEAVMPSLLADCEAAALTIDEVTSAMASVGYGQRALHQLHRWEAKRTTGRFGP